MDALSLGNELGQWLGQAQPPGLLHQFPTLEALVDHLAPAAPEPAQPKTSPLSTVQERMWFLHQLQDPEQHSIHFFDGYRIMGELDAALLARALDQVVQHNEALRTGFALHDGSPVQVVQPEASVALTEEDLRGLTEAEREQAVHEATVAQSRRPFDLIGGVPPVRFRLLRLAASEWLLMITVHHICTDAPSWGQLLKELGQRYNALCTGKEPAQREVPTFSDYVDWQQDWLESDAAAEQLAHWRRALADSPEALDLPPDHVRPAALAVKPAATHIELPPELMEAVKELAGAQGVTPFVVLLAAFDLLMARRSGQDDILIASPILSRGEARFLRTQGSFADVVVLRERLRGDPTFAELLPRVRQTVDEAFKHQDLPFSDVVAACRQGAPAQDRTPLAQVLFNPAEAGLVPRLRGCEVELASATWLSRDTYVGLGSLGFDLALWVVKRAEKQLCICAFNPDLYAQGSVDRLLGQYRELLEAAVRGPEARASELVATIPPGWRTLAVASTFTAEPLEEPLTFWMEKLGLQAKIHFAAYNQVFQELLDPSSLLQQNAHGTNLVLLRLEDWLRYEGDRTSGESDPAQKLARNVDDLIEALRGAAAGGQVPCVVALCPPSPDAVAEFGDLLSELAARLVKGLTSVSGVHLMNAEELSQRYPVEQIHDPAADAQGHIPYTPTYFTALATQTARKIAALERAPYKVIALDCDNTLWRGVCGEDGPDGVAFDPGHRALQAFMLQQREQGMVLCLSSKNVEQDVDAVFERRADEMPLKAEHVVTRRINWQPKSQGLREMAEELNLGLDSFIFVDDNEVECAEVAAALPGVLTVHLPPAEQIEAFLEHHWAFDRLGVTAEDKKRAEMYRQNVEREQARSAATSFADFLAGLELQVELAELTPETLPRVAQLTQRTNQFNATTVRRTETEIEGLAGQGLECLTMRVADRFGDYGLVGVVIYGAGDGVLEVDSFMLSCRVLGRGVEHRMVARLGEIAVERGLEKVAISYSQTPKNQPMLDFLQAVAGEHRVELKGGTLFELPATAAAAARINPVRADGAPLPKKTKNVNATQAATDAAGALAEIAAMLRSVEQIQAAVQARFRRDRTEKDAAYAAPRSEIERTLAEIWQQVLNVDRVGIHDNFFEIGGDSLACVRVSAAAAGKGLRLSPDRLIWNQTIAQLATGNLSHNEHQPDQAGPSSKQASTSCHPLASESLLSMLNKGVLAPIDAVALAYVPDSVLTFSGLSRSAIVDGLMEDKPNLVASWHTLWGHVGLVLLPLIASDLFQQSTALVEKVGTACHFSRDLGAESISLTGLLPSATDYGREVLAAGKLPQDQTLTTGHAITTAAVILSIDAVLRRTHRDIRRESMAFVGLGSIGLNVLGLALSALRHPREILLFDLKSKVKHLERVAKSIEHDHGFGGSVRICTCEDQISPEIQRASFIFGATSVGGVLDVNLLKPGTIIVDDSAPHCFQVDRAFRRFRDNADILFTEGGVLRLPGSVMKRLSLPTGAEHLASSDELQLTIGMMPNEIMGCTYSSLLTHRFPEFSATIGFPLSVDECLSQYQALTARGISAGVLHCERHLWSRKQVERFMNRCGGN